MPAGRSSTSVNDASVCRVRSTVTVRLFWSAPIRPISRAASSPSASSPRTNCRAAPVNTSRPPTFAINSPGWMPAAAAGESGRTAATRGNPSVATSVTPRPHSRVVRRCVRAASSASSRNTTEGSLARINASSNAALAVPLDGASRFSASRRAPSSTASHRPRAQSSVPTSCACAPSASPAATATAAQPRLPIRSMRLPFFPLRTSRRRPPRRSRTRSRCRPCPRPRPSRPSTRRGTPCRPRSGRSAGNPAPPSGTDP